VNRLGVSPKIVDVIIQGAQPGDLTFACVNVLPDMPLAWQAQHALLGLELRFPYPNGAVANFGSV
jgi:hypothetical protein